MSMLGAVGINFVLLQATTGLEKKHRDKYGAADSEMREVYGMSVDRCIAVSSLCVSGTLLHSLRPVHRETECVCMLQVSLVSWTGVPQ